MTEEEKAAIAAAEQANAEFEASLDGLSDEEKAAKRTEFATQRDAKSAPSHIDYEAELKKEREARDRAEKALAERRFKDAEAKRAANTAGQDDEKPLTAYELRAVLDEERQMNQSLIQENRIAETAKKLATSDTEAALIIEIHKNRTFPAHLSLDEQMEEAYVIANRKKLIGERNEALRALRGKNSVDNNPAGTHHDAPRNPVEIAPTTKAVLLQQGFTENRILNRYEKKLANGKLLIADKTGQVRLV